MSENKVSQQITNVLHRAVDLLSRREHSAQELSQKLQKKGFGENDIELAIIRLQEENLQSDDRFTESFVNERIRRGHGPIKIMHELRQRGVAENMVENYVNAEEEQWLSLVQLQYQKKYANLKVRDYSEWSKRARFLQGRGFTSAQIRNAINSVDVLD